MFDLAFKNEGECIKTTKQNCKAKCRKKLVKVELLVSFAISLIIQVPHRDISGLRGER